MCDTYVLVRSWMFSMNLCVRQMYPKIGFDESLESSLASNYCSQLIYIDMTHQSLTSLIPLLPENVFGETFCGHMCHTYVRKMRIRVAALKCADTSRPTIQQLCNLLDPTLNQLIFE